MSSTPPACERFAALILAGDRAGALALARAELA